MAQSPAPATAQVTVTPAGMPKDGVKTQADAIKVLTSNTYSWIVFGGKGTPSVRFMANNSIVCTDGWVAKWEMSGIREVILKLDKNKPGKITFSPDFTSYTGIDIRGIQPLEGKLVIPKQ